MATRPPPSGVGAAVEERIAPSAHGKGSEMAEQSEGTRGTLIQSRLASDGKQDVGLIQEKSRRRRLWKALITIGLLDAFVAYRVLNHKMPLPGPPSWFMLYLPEILRGSYWFLPAPSEPSFSAPALAAARA